MIWCGWYAAKNLIIYEWKATYHFTKKRLYTETIELIELGRARVLYMQWQTL